MHHVAEEVALHSFIGPHWEVGHGDMLEKAGQDHIAIVKAGVLGRVKVLVFGFTCPLHDYHDGRGATA